MAIHRLLLNLWCMYTFLDSYRSGRWCGKSVRKGGMDGNDIEKKKRKKTSFWKTIHLWLCNCDDWKRENNLLYFHIDTRDISEFGSFSLWRKFSSEALLRTPFGHHSVIKHHDYLKRVNSENLRLRLVVDCLDNNYPNCWLGLLCCQKQWSSHL